MSLDVLSRFLCFLASQVARNVYDGSAWTGSCFLVFCGKMKMKMGGFEISKTTKFKYKIRWMSSSNVVYAVCIRELGT
jgi:hypothetical protein